MDAPKLAVPLQTILKSYPELGNLDSIDRIMTGDPLTRLTPINDEFFFLSWVKNRQSFDFAQRRDIRKLKYVFNLNMKTLADLLKVDSHKLFRWLKPSKNDYDFLPIRRSHLSNIFKDLAGRVENAAEIDMLREKALAFDCKYGLPKGLNI